MTEAANYGNGAGRQGDRTDPTTLTTAQLLREVENLDRYLTDKIDAVSRAAIVANENLNRVPTETEKSVEQLRRLIHEKFDGLEKLMDERFSGVSRDSAQRDKGVADLFTERDKSVQVALQAAEKAVGKQNEASDRAIQKAEDATTKSLDALQNLFRSDLTGIRTEINALRDSYNANQSRIQAIESGGVGATTERVNQRGDRDERRHASTLTVYMIAVGITLFGLLLSAGVSIAIHFIP